MVLLCITRGLFVVLGRDARKRGHVVFRVGFRERDRWFGERGLVGGKGGKAKEKELGGCVSHFFLFLSLAVTIHFLSQ